jgi:hypothetical protein
MSRQIPRAKIDMQALLRDYRRSQSPARRSETFLPAGTATKPSDSEARKVEKAEERMARDTACCSA